MAFLSHLKPKKGPKHEKYIPRIPVDFSFLANQAIGDFYFPFFSEGYEYTTILKSPHYKSKLYNTFTNNN